jgi:hypothetical protein
VRWAVEIYRVYPELEQLEQRRREARLLADLLPHRLPDLVERPALDRARVDEPRVSIFELAGLMGTSVKMIDKTYGHLAQDSEEAIQARLETRGGADAQRQRGQ